MHSGAGLVTLGIPKGINSAVIKIKPKEVMTLPLAQDKSGSLSLAAYKKINEIFRKTDILVIGPGLGQEASTKALVRKIMAHIDRPAVVDADALNALAGSLKIIEGKDVVITPHPAELSRLLGIPVRDIQARREKVAKKAAKDHKLTLVLKGHHTVVADQRGNIYINKTGNPGMATAGSGDVLTGIIASFLGQGLDRFEAAKYAVFLHGMAGDLAAKEKTQLGMVASDIIDMLPAAIKRSS